MVEGSKSLPPSMPLTGAEVATPGCGWQLRLRAGLGLTAVGKVERLANYENERCPVLSNPVTALLWVFILTSLADFWGGGSSYQNR